MNVTENRRGYRRSYREWTFQRNWQHWVHKTKTSTTKAQHRKIKGWATRTPPKNGDEHWCSRRVNSSGLFEATRHVTQSNVAIKIVIVIIIFS